MGLIRVAKYYNNYKEHPTTYLSSHVIYEVIMSHDDFLY